jgi:hypothetical protein
MTADADMISITTPGALETFDRLMTELKVEFCRDHRRWIHAVWRDREATRNELRQKVSIGNVSPADAVADLEKQLDAEFKRRKQRHSDRYLIRRIPSEYREPIVRSRLPNLRAFDEVLGWFNRDLDTADYCGNGRNLGDRGIIAVGRTGQAKTRALASLLITGSTSRECGGEGYWDFDDTADAGNDWFNSCLFLPATQLKREATINAGKPGVEKWVRKEAEELIESARTCDVLLLDDLSQPKLTPAYAECLYEIIEHRTSCRLLNLVSLQLGRDEFLAKVSDGNPNLLTTAEAIFRRLTDYCDVIDFDDADGVYDHAKWLAAWIEREGWNDV